jgi:plastocyanin
MHMGRAGTFMLLLFAGAASGCSDAGPGHDVRRWLGGKGDGVADAAVDVDQDGGATDDGGDSIDAGHTDPPDLSVPPDLLQPSRTLVVTVGPNNKLSFSPDPAVIRVNDTVKWVWASSHHNVVSGTDGNADGRFCSPSDKKCDKAPTANTGTTYSHTFTTAGTFPYFCTPHAMFGMTGTVIVQ